MDCIFCKIINKEIPSNIFYEDGNTVAFLNISPTTKGHSLIVPKIHSRNLLDMNAKEIGYMSEALATVPKKLKEVLGAEGMNIIANNEKTADQAIFHTHIHLIPRYPDDGLKPWPHTKADQEDLDRLKDKLIKSF